MADTTSTDPYVVIQEFNQAPYTFSSSYNVTYNEAVTQLGALKVEGMNLIVDSGWGANGDQVVNLSNATVGVGGVSGYSDTFTPQPGSGFASTCNLPPATLKVTKTSGTASGVVNETDIVQNFDTGNAFRVVDCKYQYVLSIPSLPGAGRYHAEIQINGTTVGNAYFDLKQADSREDGEAVSKTLRPLLHPHASLLVPPSSARPPQTRAPRSATPSRAPAPRSLEREYRREVVGTRWLVVEPHLGDLRILEAVDSELVSLGPPSLALGPPIHDDCRVIIEIEERFWLELERTLGDLHEFLEERDDLLTTFEVARVILLTGLVVPDLVSEESANRLPISACSRSVELPDHVLVCVHILDPMTSSDGPPLARAPRFVKSGV
jgi:hypothetical protein